MFRIANQRSNNLMEMQAQMMLMTVAGTSQKPERKFELLNLERTSILFFALTWTVVHPIDESSPRFGERRRKISSACRPKLHYSDQGVR